MQKLEQFGARYGMVSPNIFPNFECLPHWKKSGSLSEGDLGIFAIRLKGEIRRGESGSSERGE